jgi:putative ABC transport system ATP-binding protein
MAGGMSQSVLKQINFTLESGEFVAIMGHSGSGKSTLMNILGCLDRPTSGDYFLDGQNVSDKNDQELAHIRGQKIGFVFQNFNLLMKRSIADNVSLPLIYQNVSEKERRERALKMLQTVQLNGYEDRLPTQISGGMQQRVAIARALINNPKIIFADEPTAELDTLTGLQVVKIFKDLTQAEGVTIIMTTHDTGLMEIGDAVFELEDGEVVHGE